jgi:hypothetical protein
MASPLSGEAAVPQTLHAGAALATGLALSDFTFEQFWTTYMAMGGNHPPVELAAYLLGDVDCTPHEHDVAAHALNERCTDLGLGRPVRYADEIHQ